MSIDEHLLPQGRKDGDARIVGGDRICWSITKSVEVKVETTPRIT